ncbi:anillin [Halyomorpha halys]|uniref:anillin n=1 Tax=Halyomorpha halys TaxID=286706 RepID=UPI0006D5120F|nr:anillin [Halyomorpha halys]
MESDIQLALKRMKNVRDREDFDLQHNVDICEKENSHPLLRDKTKTRLQRLGVLYGGGEISSPIHKSEQNWEDEDEDDNTSGDKSPYAERRARRLQALANTINSWEDDMRHISPKKEQEERVDRFGNKVGSKAVKHDAVQIPLKIQNGQQAVQGQTPKKVAWDRRIISSLEMQGFKRCDSEEHLVYNYVSPDSKECLSPTKRQQQNVNHPRSASPRKINVNKSEETSLPQPKVKSTETKELVSQSQFSLGQAVATHIRERSPQHSVVLELAAQYEADSPLSKKTGNSNVDPALLSVAEKKAVFERNQGALPVPQQFFKKRDLSPPKRMPKVFSQEARPESSSSVTVKDSVKQAMIERFQELEALRHRWDRNKASSTAKNLTEEQITEVPEIQKSEVNPQIPPPPPLPVNSFSLKEPSPIPLPVNSYSVKELSPPRTPSPPQIKMGVSSPVGKRSPPCQLPRVLSVKEKTNRSGGQHYPEVKKIKVSPPKPGRLYPSISDIEAESEVPETDLETIDEEYMDEDEPGVTSFSDSSNLETSHSSLSSFGKEIVRQASRTNLKRPSQSLESSSSENESKILKEMDDLLDEALGSPSPKRTRDSTTYKLDTNSLQLSTNSETCSTTSFEFSDAENLQARYQSENSSEANEPKTPLMYSVSLYRKQRQQQLLTPIRKEIRREEVILDEEPNCSKLSPKSEEKLVQEKIKELTIELQRQIETVSQASKALNLCLSTPGFMGSTAEVEAQKLLLVASARWTSLKQEIERLRIEKRLRSGDCELDRGDINIQSISVPLKTCMPSRDQSSVHLVCLIRSGYVVLQTEVVTLDKASIRNGRISFQKMLNLVDLYSDFTVSVEVYGFIAQHQTELAPDYKHRTTPSKKDKNRSAAKKAKDKFIPVESPAGPNAVRSSAFQLWGFAVFSLRELNRNSFSLSKVPYTCPLEGSIEISMTSSMQSQIEHTGFLTVFEDVGGFGAWKRRWCQLKGSCLAFWTYPEQFLDGKVAIDTIDLSGVSTVEAALAPRDVCARPHTILLESQLRGSNLQESLVVKRRGDITVHRHLLAADTHEERLAWCKQINKVLHLLRTWKVNCATAV